MDFRELGFRDIIFMVFISHIEGGQVDLQKLYGAWANSSRRREHPSRIKSVILVNETDGIAAGIPPMSGVINNF
jgi:hypothetical protein